MFFLLKDLLTGPDGRALTPWHTTKAGGRTFRYYLSTRDTREGRGASGVPRMPVAELEAAVVGQLRHLLRVPEIIEAMVPQATALDPSLDAARVTVAMTQVERVWDELFPAEQQGLIRVLVEKVIVTRPTWNCASTPRHRHSRRRVPPDRRRGIGMTRATLSVCGPTTEVLASNGSIVLNVPIALKRRSGRRVVLPVGAKAAASRTPATLLQLVLARGHRWLRMLEAGEAASMRDIARREGTNPSYIARRINLTLLAPEIVVVILDEAVPEGVQLLMLAINPTLQLDEEREQLTTVNSCD